MFERLPRAPASAILVAVHAPSGRPLRLFVSFSPEDQELKDELLKHLAVLQQIGKVDPWGVDKIRAGGDWRQEVEAALAQADVAVLLLSADFLASSFLQDVEIPKLFERRTSGGLHVVPIILRTCSWQFHPWISKLKPLPSAGKAVAAYDGDWRDQILAEIACAVADISSPSDRTGLPLPEATPSGKSLDMIERKIRELSPDDFAAMDRILAIFQQRKRLFNSSDHAAPAHVSAAGEPSRLAPSYPDDDTRVLSEKLMSAQARKSRLLECGADPVEVVCEILDLKRKLRDGGQLKAGDSLGDGRYVLLNVIGRGGFATVWRAHDSKTNDVVAIKVLHSNLAGDRVRLERFRRGARVMDEVRHDAILRVLEPCAEDLGWHYFVMACMPEGDLRHAVLAGKLNWSRASDGMLQICEAVGYAHKKGVVHRDIKPANILIDRDGTLKLADFDLVGVGDTTGGTRTGALGTFVYTPPEAMEHPHEADSRSDVFSLGMTIAFCIYGRDLPIAMVGRPSDLVDQLPCADSLKTILRKATNWEDKNLRYSDAAALGVALLAATEASVVEVDAFPRDRKGASVTIPPPQARKQLAGSKGLSANQLKVLQYIRKSISERGYPPTLREIGAHMGIQTADGVSDHLRELERKGYLVRQDPVSRSEQLSGRGADSMPPEDDGEVIEIPIVGRIAAGLPLLAEEHVLDTLRIELAMVHGRRDVFGLRVSGDSMVEAGILNGAYIFVGKQNRANAGDIVVVLIGEEATVAYYFPERDYVRFQPANGRMAPILVRAIDFRADMILGVVVGVFRKQ